MTEAVENQAWDQIRIIFQDFRIAPSRLGIITSVPELLHKHGKISGEKAEEMSDLVTEIFGENGIRQEETSNTQKIMMADALGEIDEQLQS